MRKIELTQGYTALVDDEDYQRVIDAGPWHAALNTRNDGTVKGIYAHHNTRVNGQSTSTRLHHFVLRVDKSVEIDHKDRNGLNNQKENLRKAEGKNSCNAGLYRSNTSGFKGVSVHRNVHGPIQWKAQVRCGGAVHYLGLFPTAREAALAYDAEAKRLFGEFASTNFKGGLCQTH
jgi:hypothetical protein